MIPQDTQGLFLKPGLEDSFQKMLLVRHRQCDLKYLHIVNIRECEGEFERQKGYYDGHNQTGKITHNKILINNGQKC